METCILGSNSSDISDSSARGQESQDEDLLADFGLQVLDAALVGLPAECDRANTIKQFIWALLRPDGEEAHLIID